MDLARKAHVRLSAEVTLQLYLDHVADADEVAQTMRGKIFNG